MDVYLLSILAGLVFGVLISLRYLIKLNIRNEKILRKVEFIEQKIQLEVVELLKNISYQKAKKARRR